MPIFDSDDNEDYMNSSMGEYPNNSRNNRGSDARAGLRRASHSKLSSGAGSNSGPSHSSNAGSGSGGSFSEDVHGERRSTMFDHNSGLGRLNRASSSIPQPTKQGVIGPPRVKMPRPGEGMARGNSFMPKSSLGHNLRPLPSHPMHDMSGTSPSLLQTQGPKFGLDGIGRLF